MAQPTTALFARVLMVQSAHDRGTIFALNVDQREYWITAKHILTGKKHPPHGTLENKSTLLQILNPGVEGEQWVSVTFSVIDPGNDVDIVVLAPPNPLFGEAASTISTGSDNVVLGGDCEFMGFPFGAGWHGTYNGKPIWMSFVKHCTVSGVVPEPERFWVLDAINNGGFSGGPVFTGTGSQLKIVGVVSGYRTEPTDVIPSDPAVKPNATANLNSGFFIAYDIEYAIDAIHKNPIGALYKEK